jgi:hypothetical protein
VPKIINPIATAPFVLKADPGRTLKLESSATGQHNKNIMIIIQQHKTRAYRSSTNIIFSSTGLSGLRHMSYEMYSFKMFWGDPVRVNFFNVFFPVYSVSFYKICDFSIISSFLLWF